MDIIITVLNHIFDENNKTLYVGNKTSNTNLYLIPHKTNLVLNNMNKHSVLTARKNKGKIIYPTYLTSDPAINIKYNLSKNKKRHTLRKIKKNI